MRFRAAVSTFAALSCLTMVGVAGSLVSADHPAAVREAQLAGNQWGVEMSADYGSTWTTTLDSSTPAAFPVQVKLDALAEKNFYQPITLRTAVGTTDPAQVQLQQAELISGTPEQAAAVQIRMATSPRGYCASSLFDTAGPGGTPIPPRPATEATVPEPVTLQPAFSTTAGQPETVCIEFSVDRGTDERPHGELMLAWPMQAQPADKIVIDADPHADRVTDVQNSVPSAPDSTEPEPGR